MAYGDYNGPDKADKGKENGSCNRGRCQCAPARWYNHGSYAWYCDDCKTQINDAVGQRHWAKDFPNAGHPMFETREQMDARLTPSPQPNVQPVEVCLWLADLILDAQLDGRSAETDPEWTAKDFTQHRAYQRILAAFSPAPQTKMVGHETAISQSLHLAQAGRRLVLAHGYGFADASPPYSILNPKHVDADLRQHGPEIPEDAEKQHDDRASSTCIEPSETVEVDVGSSARDETESTSEEHPGSYRFTTHAELHSCFSGESGLGQTRSSRRNQLAPNSVPDPAPRMKKSGQDRPHDRAENHDEAYGHSEKTEHSGVGVETANPSEPPARPLISVFHEITPGFDSDQDNELTRESLGSTSSIKPPAPKSDGEP